MSNPAAKLRKKANFVRQTQICRKMKKVYFAGSIRGGREDAGLYRRLIQYIQKDNIVLTEHIGDLSLSKTESLGDSAIYEQDTAWLRESDLVIAECSTPSLGVGYELAYAEAHLIPVHIFYNHSRTQLSAMLKRRQLFSNPPLHTGRRNLLPP